MMKIFIDGSSGTTGLRIADRLSARKDIELVSIPEELRKDNSAKKEIFAQCDAVFLCLPDAAAIESAELVGENTVVLDTSTAHRVDPEWVYGFPELSGEQFAKVASAKRIAVPGCHASGFIALIAPLVSAGIVPQDAFLVATSVTGYSGGGKKMIAQYEAEDRDAYLDSPRQYGLTQKHKHLPEMKKMTGLDTEPVFQPIVSDFYSGMAVTVPLNAKMINGNAESIRDIYKALYTGPVVAFDGEIGNDGFLPGNLLAGKDTMKIGVLGNEDRILLTAVYDNLGKGASGAAIECMNIVMGLSPETGLEL